MKAKRILKKSKLLIGFFYFILFGFAFLVYSNSTFSQKSVSDTMIQWSSVPLKATDFTIIPDTATTAFLAYTETKNFYLKRIVKKQGKEYLDVKIINNFWKTKSYIKKSYLSDTLLLKHEQGHFNISEICARRLVKELDSMNLPSDYLKELVKTSDENFKLMQQAHLDYDRATDHGSNRFMQKFWNRKIQEGLEELNQYSEKQVTILLKMKLP